MRKTACLISMAIVLLLSSTAHSQPCEMTRAVSPGETAECGGFLVPEGNLRAAVLCVRTTVPNLQNDLRLCRKQAKIDIKAMLKKIEARDRLLVEMKSETTAYKIATYTLAGALLTAAGVAFIF